MSAPSRIRYQIIATKSGELPNADIRRARDVCIILRDLGFWAEFTIADQFTGETISVSKDAPPPPR